MTELQRDLLIHLGFEVGTAADVSIPLRHMAVTGQTQESGKTTTLEALVERAQVTALAFVTKRGESAFASGHRVQPYFRDRADWQFVTSIIDATLQEKNKFLRPWIMRICRNTRSLADVQRAVRGALTKARKNSINEGVYTQLDAYLDLIVPVIARAELAPTLELHRGLNVMDVSSFSTPMQMLFVQSALDWVNEKESNTVVVIPEAWEFIPEGKGSPVKASAEGLVRKGAGIGNYIWVDSQDMAGVDKVVLRGCPVWIIGVQREANEIKRTLANIPAGIKKPSAAAVATLQKGQFFACWSTHAVKTYVQPGWMTSDVAIAIARGELNVEHMRKPIQPKREEDGVNEAEVQALRDENHQLRREIAELRRQIGAPAAPARVADAEQVIDRAIDRVVALPRPSAPTKTTAFEIGDEALYQRVRDRLLAEDPAPLLRLLSSRPELRVEVTRETITVDGKSLRGRIGRMIADGFFEKARTSSDILTEIERRGAPKPSNIEIGLELKALSEMGFFTRENKWYNLAPNMAVNVVER